MASKLASKTKYLGYSICRNTTGSFTVSLGTPLNLNETCPGGVYSFMNSTEALDFQETGLKTYVYMQ